MSKYPEYCFTALPTTGEVVMIHPLRMGYSPTREGNQPWEGQELADILNRDHGVTKAQAKAMEIGSMFGWEVPGADPEMYDEEGNFRK